MGRIDWRLAGIYILALISLMFAIVAALDIWVLVITVRSAAAPAISEQGIWTVFVSNVVIIILFCTTAYGLWRRHNWGRVAFLWLITGWSLINIVFLWQQPDITFRGQLFNMARYTIAPIWSLWYLNRPAVKSIFIDGLPLPEEEANEAH